MKQEIAKQGILPKSLLLATSTITPWAYLRRFCRRHLKRHSDTVHEPSLAERYPDQSPIAALVLHWFSSIFLIAVTAGLEPETSYTVLISLYAYVINGMMGFIAAGGLLWLKYFHEFMGKVAEKQRRKATSISQFSLGSSRWTNSLPAWIYCLFTGFLLAASFVPPAEGDTNYSVSRAGIPWYAVPTIGLSTPLWGLIWYGGLKVVEWHRGETLKLRRVATIKEFKWSSRWRSGSEWVMTSEVIKREWTTRGHQQDGYGMDQRAQSATQHGPENLYRSD